jgi:hypothetical protein
MTTTITLTHEAGRGVEIESLHDHVVSLVAQRWAQSFRCRVTIKPSVAQAGLTSEEHVPDIIGWQYHPAGNRVEWIAEIETAESLSQPDLGERLQERASAGVAFYLFVPTGCRPATELLATAVGVYPNGIYEYRFVNGMLQLA